MPSDTLHFSDARHLSQLYANDPRYLDEIDHVFGTKTTTRDDWITFEGEPTAIGKARDVFEILDTARKQGLRIRGSDLHHTLRSVSKGRAEELRDIYRNPFVIELKQRSIIPKTLNQKRYLQAIEQHPITFGIGPAGTGKTYLAMAMALRDLLAGSVERIIITRPAVEAGEALGFLPGELQEKILPYLTPLYDAMHQMIGKESASQLLERGIIEIAPLAYMRGRTLSNAFVVLDEAQNTTHEQMMMFLTRLGDGSRMVVTGDVTQIDLPRTKLSGLVEATRILGGIKNIELFNFSGEDVIRHPLVQSIIRAYAQQSQE
ncbi:MAG: PhoH-like protein [Opitutia bacterium UBA7350]|nr:MAG: PhoH-like protein [Opitutae bacterium UBA7350]